MLIVERSSLSRFISFYFRVYSIGATASTRRPEEQWMEMAAVKDDIDTIDYDIRTMSDVSMSKYYSMSRRANRFMELR